MERLGYKAEFAHSLRPQHRLTDATRYESAQAGAPIEPDARGTSDDTFGGRPINPSPPNLVHKVVVPPMVANAVHDRTAIGGVPPRQ